MKQSGGNGLAAFLTSCLVVGLVTGAAPVSADSDIVTPIDPATGEVLVAPGDSALAGDVTFGPPKPNPPPYTTEPGASIGSSLTMLASATITHLIRDQT
jgi:hypothetical protein